MDSVKKNTYQSYYSTFVIYAKALRVHQWVKNLLLFVPLIFGHHFNQFLPVCWAFASFCFCASSIYIVNDFCDLEHDRKHPVKRHRPFASGLIPLRIAPRLFIICFILSLLPCLFLPSGFLFSLASYFFLSLCYSFFFKKRLFMDVLVLAGLYVLRIVAGAACMSNYISNWLLGFAGFMFLGLALLKRTGAMFPATQEAGCRLLGRDYRTEDYPILESMALCSGFAAFVVIALYIDSLKAVELHSSPALLWGICPLLVYWYGRLALLAHRGEIKDDPVNFAVRDRASYVACFCK